MTQRACDRLELAIDDGLSFTVFYNNQDEVETSLLLIIIIGSVKRHSIIPEINFLSEASSMNYHFSMYREFRMSLHNLPLTLPLSLSLSLDIKI